VSISSGTKGINMGTIDGTTTVLEEGEELWVVLEFWGDLVLNDISIVERCQGDHSEESMENTV
jgi:hypothetical protein